MMDYPECNLGKARPYEEVWGNFLPNLQNYYAHPTDYNIEPFQIYGNLYYVGDKKVCMHLIDTGDGLVLFDSGYSHNYGSLLESIRKLGFSPEDVKIVIHSHAHFDHMGGGDRLRDSFGTKVAMSRVDTELTREMPERVLMRFARILINPFVIRTFCWKTMNRSPSAIRAFCRSFHPVTRLAR